jgi:alanyl-tRNA synthetase
MSKTERLYYAAAAPRAFDAVVRRVEPRDGQLAVWLDRTGFYPTSGGQPHDLGNLAGLAVVDVVEDQQGDIVHLLSSGASTLTEGAHVRGEVEWSRRLDHMQQHTGQHILSAVLERLYHARTVSFHLGTDSSTIDLDRELTPAQLSEGELEANRVIWDDRGVDVRFATADEARELPLRKESVREGTLRLIEIDGVDLSACGGTHVERTGAIGQVALGSFERFKGGQRVEFLCGRRALRRHQQLRELSTAAIRLLSVLPAELPSAIERLQTEAKAAGKALLVAQQELAKYEAVAFADGAEAVGGIRLVTRAIEGDAVRLKALASAIVTRPGLAVVLVSPSRPALAVAARSADVTLSCQDLITAVAKRFGGRGGGKPDLAQCGGLDGSPEAILEYARAAVQA